MITITGFTADRMKQIEDSTVTSGLVDAQGNLILSQRDGSHIQAGHVVGPPGPKGDTGSKGDQGPKGEPGKDGASVPADGSVTYAMLASGVLAPANLGYQEAAVTDFPTGWTNYGSDSNGAYAPLRVLRINSKLCALQGMIKNAGGQTANTSVSSTVNALPSWARPREHALAFFGAYNGGPTLTVRVGVWGTGKIDVWVPSGTNLASGAYLALSIVYPLP